MKLAALYNVFDGEELLEASINSIRENVDEVIVVWQNVSYSGVQHPNTNIRDFLYSLKDKKLIDQLIYFIPSRRSALSNEIAKRNIALQAALESKCTHCIPMDVDEFYKPEQLARLKDWLYNGTYGFKKLKGLYTFIKTYYKYSNIILGSLEEYRVPALYEISADSMFDACWNIPHKLVDPARRISGMTEDNTFTVHPHDLCVMHHLSYVRKNLPLKLTCSSAFKNMEHEIPSLLEDYRKFEPVNDARIDNDISMCFSDAKIHMPFNRYFSYEVVECPKGTEQFMWRG